MVNQNAHIASKKAEITWTKPNHAKLGSLIDFIYSITFLIYFLSNMKAFICITSSKSARRIK
jgi:hypothetical protein